MKFFHLYFQKSPPPSNLLKINMLVIMVLYCDYMNCKNIVWICEYWKNQTCFYYLSDYAYRCLNRSRCVSISRLVKIYKQKKRLKTQSLCGA